MKKTYIVIYSAILFCWSTVAHAQLNFGIKAGYNSSLTLGNFGSVTTGSYDLNSVKAEMGNNFHAGVFARVTMDKFYFEPELLYTMQKKEYQVTFEDVSNGEVTLDKFVNVSAIDVPLLLGYKLIDLKILNVRAFAGPKFRFLAGSSLDFNNIAGGDFDLEQLKYETKKAKIGLEVGAGIDVLMFAIDARYNIIENMVDATYNGKTLARMPASTFVISLAWKLF